MPKTDETLAAILADYRADIPAMTSGELPHPTPEYLRILLDRIEAAAKNMRAMLDGNIARVRELEEMLDGAANTVLGCAIKDKRSAAPGNAAAMRTALEWVADFSSDDYIDDEYSTDGENLQRAAERARAALAAPARNCDTNMKDASARWNGYKMSAPCPPGGWDEGDLFDWLFASAEGGAE